MLIKSITELNIDRKTQYSLKNAKNFTSKSIMENFTPVFRSKAEKPESKNLKQTKIIQIAGLATVGIVALLAILKSKNVFNTIGDKISDIKFKKNIVKSLKKEGIKCNIKNLKSIVAPNEFKRLVKKFKPEHYAAGLHTLKELPLDEFYKNSVDGNFRVSLHTHTNFSDGRATIQEFLDCASNYAKKIKRIGKEDGLPPFMIALTDHDNIDGVKEAIRIIAKNPDKYKELKFVTGCENSVKSFMGQHDVTSLAFNPFDENLNKMLDDLKVTRTETIEKFLEVQDVPSGKRVSFEDLVQFEREKNKLSKKETKRTMENKSGVVFVRRAIKFYHDITRKTLDNNLLNYMGTKDNLDINKVVETVKQAGGYTSLTHPLKSFWHYIGDDNLMKFKNMGVSGIEANHQYTPSKLAELKVKSGMTGTAEEVYQDLTDKYLNFASKNGMFVSGGTDSHRNHIFGNFSEITSDLMEKIMK